MFNIIETKSMIRSCARPVSEFMDLRRSSELPVRTSIPSFALSQFHLFLPSLAIQSESVCMFLFLLGAFGPSRFWSASRQLQAANDLESKWAMAAPCPRFCAYLIPAPSIKAIAVACRRLHI